MDRLERSLPEPVFRRYARFFAKKSPDGLERRLAALQAAVMNLRLCWVKGRVATADDLMPGWWWASKARPGGVTDAEWDRFNAWVDRGIQGDPRLSRSKRR